jgi:DNA-binding transcriptional LysR family regulator
MNPSVEPSWELFGAFLAVVETGSLSAAARSLGVAQPTVRRHVHDLEQRLGAVLFTRSPAGLSPTPVALAAVPHARAIAASARAFVRSASDTAAARGTVRLAASEIVGVEVLPAILAALARTDPEIQIELVLSNRNEDLLRRDADVAVRMMRPTQAGLVARRIGDIQVGLFATAGYLARHSAPKRAADLLDHALVGGDRDRGMVDALESAGVAARPASFALRTDNHVAQLAAVRAGLGIGACQVALARDLVRVLPRVAFPLDTYVVMHEDLRGVARARRVFDHLVTTLGAYAKLGT